MLIGATDALRFYSMSSELPECVILSHINGILLLDIVNSTVLITKDDYSLKMFSYILTTNTDTNTLNLVYP